MDLEEVLHKLEEAKELKDWDMIEECIDAIRVLIDDFDEYNNEETLGLKRYRQMLFNNRVQQRLSRSRNKILTKPKWRIIATRVGNRLALSQY